MAKTVLLEAGARFGRLTVKELAARGSAKEGRRDRVYLCVCDCGNSTEVRSGNLRSGSTKSCGCYRKDSAAKQHTKHGMFGTPEYSAWSAMWTRCSVPSSKPFKNYGQRGISVDPAWRDFAVFFSDLGRKPTSKHQLDRVNNSLGYSKANCRWATCKENQNNRRNNIKFTVQGVTYTLAEAAEASGLRSATIQARRARGWPDDLLLSPLKSNGKRKQNGAA